MELLHKTLQQNFVILNNSHVKYFVNIKDNVEKSPTVMIFWRCAYEEYTMKEVQEVYSQDVGVNC